MNNATRTFTDSRGYTLLEIAAALVLLSAFSVAAVQLFDATLRVIRKGHEAPNQMAARARSLDALRRDVWNARRIAVPNERTVRLQTGGGVRVRWEANAEAGLLVRNAGDDSATSTNKRWTLPGGGYRFERAGTGVIVTPLRSPDRRAGAVRLVSQLGLAREGP